MEIKRFLAIFYPPAEFNKIQVTINIENETFNASGKVCIKEGYLEITFQPFSNYAYMKYNKKITVYDSNSFRINNPSASNEVYKPIIKIKTFEDTPDTIIIENETTGCEPFIIQNLNPNEVITVDSLLGTVYNDKNENLLMNCNRKWLNLNRGENKINILGNAEIDIKCQFPVVM